VFSPGNLLVLRCSGRLLADVEYLPFLFCSWSIPLGCFVAGAATICARFSIDCLCRLAGRHRLRWRLFCLLAFLRGLFAPPSAYGWQPTSSYVLHSTFACRQAWALPAVRWLFSEHCRRQRTERCAWFIRDICDGFVCALVCGCSARCNTVNISSRLLHCLVMASLVLLPVPFVILVEQDGFRAFVLVTQAFRRCGALITYQRHLLSITVFKCYPMSDSSRGAMPVL